MSENRIASTSYISCAADEIHVWRVVLDCTATEFSALEGVLSGDERVRASGFKTMELRRRWTTARGALRMILAAYLATEPKSLVFATDANGKPKVAEIDPVLSFNLSHTAHLAFVAVTTDGLVGIDSEILRAEIDWEGISRRFFAREEASDIRSLPPELRIQAFFTCWTRKEAYLKALGFGLYAALDKFAVTVRSDEVPCLTWVEGSDDEPGKWGFWDLNEPGFAVTLASKPLKSILRRYAFSLPLAPDSGQP